METKRHIDYNAATHFIINLITLSAVAVLTISYVDSFGKYPWGSDVYGHIYKSNILYDALKQGNWFLNFDPNWYNGLQPYRYWPPLSYYMIAGINFFTKDIISAYNVFLIVIFIGGGLGFLEWGYYAKRQVLGLFCGILWFFIPINGDIIFAQGNVPFIMVNTLIPHIFLFYYKCVNERKIRHYVILSMLMALVTLSHPMLTAMIGVSMFVYSLCHTLLNKMPVKNIITLFYAAIGITVSSIWLFPALKGGLVSSGSSSTSEFMINLLTFPFKNSLNPLLRLRDKEVFYFGLSFVIVALFGWLFGYKDRKSGFIVTILILIGTSKFTLPFLSKLPMNQVFWMCRFTPIAMCMVLFSLILWKELRKSLLIFFCGLMLLDSLVSFKLKAYHTPFPAIKADFIEKAAKMAVQRVGMLDCSQFGSFPSYYISYQKVSSVRSQVFGWAWIGATTSTNIVQVNYALEEGFFGAMFDRCLELGADVLVVRKTLIKDFNELGYWSKKCGYENKYEDENVIIYKYNIDHTFGTVVEYEGIGIGKYAANITYMFPNFIVGSKPYIEDYSVEELSKYKVIFISGIEFRNKKQAEKILKELAEKGIRIVVDFTGMDAEGFGGVVPQTITFDKKYTGVYYEGKIRNFSDFPEEYVRFKTVFLTGKHLKDSENMCIVNNQKIQYLYKADKNITYIALNLPYYAIETKDPAATEILEDCLGMRAYTLPFRRTVPVDISFNKDNSIMIKSAESNVVTSLAAADVFKASKGQYESQNHLVKVKDKEVSIKISYPYKKVGIVMSITAVVLIFFITIGITKIKWVQNIK